MAFSFKYASYPTVGLSFPFDRNSLWFPFPVTRSFPSRGYAVRSLLSGLKTEGSEPVGNVQNWPVQFCSLTSLALQLSVGAAWRIRTEAMAATTAIASSIATASSSSIAGESSSSKASRSSRDSCARPLCRELSSSFHSASASLRLEVSKATSYVAPAAGGRGGAARATIAVTPPAKVPRKKSLYELETFTGWLLREEQEGVIDGELTIVLSSIAVACKQIASLVQRAGISNLTGVQGAVNVQGEDQKKLDVISNEVSPSLPLSLCLSLASIIHLILKEVKLLVILCSSGRATVEWNSLIP